MTPEQIATLLNQTPEEIPLSQELTIKSLQEHCKELQEKLLLRNQQLLEANVDTDFYKRRINLIEKHLNTFFRDPERIFLGDVLANGALSPSPARYSHRISNLP